MVPAVVARRQSDRPRVGLGPDGEQPTAADRDPGVVDASLGSGQPDRRVPRAPLIQAHPGSTARAAPTAGSGGSSVV